MATCKHLLDTCRIDARYCSAFACENVPVPASRPDSHRNGEMLKKVIKCSYILLELLIAITQVIYQLAQFKKAVSAHDDLLLTRLQLRGPSPMQCLTN